jgi:plasmid stability protein
VATLHVRNVPEPLYELLRTCAEREGRSIGAETIVLLQGALVQSVAARDRIRSFVSAPRSSAIQRFSDPARQAVRRAQNEARALNHEAVGTEHVLLALVDEVPGLGRAGLDSTAVRAHLQRGRGKSPGRIPFDESSKRALELALRESLSTRSPTIDAGHLLVGVLLAGGRGAEILREHGFDEGGLRATVLLPFAAMPAPREDERRYLTVDLEGSAERWTERLNELAADGWELLLVTPLGSGVRVIFRRA